MMIAASAAKKTSIAPDPGAAETNVRSPSGPEGPAGAGVRDESALTICVVRSARGATLADGQGELGSSVALTPRPGTFAAAPAARDAGARGLSAAAKTVGMTVPGTLVEVGWAAPSSLGGLGAPDAVVAADDGDDRLT
jgi:hypothetical protein